MQSNLKENTLRLTAQGTEEEGHSMSLTDMSATVHTEYATSKTGLQPDPGQLGTKYIVFGLAFIVYRMVEIGLCWR